MAAIGLVARMVMTCAIRPSTARPAEISVRAYAVWHYNVMTISCYYAVFIGVVSLDTIIQMWRQPLAKTVGTVISG